MTTKIDVDFIASRNTHLTRDEIIKRAELTPAMFKRIADHRNDMFYSTFYPAGETDEDIALGFVAADAAAERDRLNSK